MMRKWNYLDNHPGDKKIIQQLSNAIKYVSHGLTNCRIWKGGLKTICVTPVSGRWAVRPEWGSGSRSKDLELDVWFLTPSGLGFCSQVWMGGKEPLGGSVSTA